ARAAARRQPRARQAGHPRRGPRVPGRGTAAQRARDVVRRAHLPRHRAQDAGDRKSTRLNSSHVKISYAVFCLKKKKKKQKKRNVAGGVVRTRKKNYAENAREAYEPKYRALREQVTDSSGAAAQTRTGGLDNEH